MQNTEYIIEAENLVKRFGNFTANDNLSFKVRKGEIFGFLGANGAGKTTAIKILCGLWSPTSGNITVAGYDVNKKPDKIKENIGYMSQKFSLYEDLTVSENFSFYGGIYRLSNAKIKEKTRYFLDKLELTESKDTILSSLPLGWKQKLAFSVAVMHEPKIVFLDEPTSGVDPAARRKFWDLINETAHEGITVFVTTHYMDEAEYCDRVSVMVSGRIEALDSPLNLKERYGVKTMNDVFLKIARD